MPTDTLDGLLTQFEEALSAIETASSPEELEAVRLRLLGRKGLMADIAPQLGTLTKEERPAWGQRINAARTQAEERLAAQKATLEASAGPVHKGGVIFDPTLPGTPPTPGAGSLHPFTGTLEKVLAIFGALGFETVYGPEIETDYYNFEALNIGPDHPARDSQDSFYLNAEAGLLLRTQTSPVQIRAMKERTPPLMIVAPGRVFRRDPFTARHSPVFHQIEGLMVDKGITFGHLKAVLELFAKELYGHDRKIRMRPDFFPFTEPSGDLAVSCAVCEGAGCRVCSQSGWVELLGCGMVHPQVLRNGGIDPDIYTGFAFGMGLDRLAMMATKINDIRLLYENDVRFLEQF